MHRAALVTLNMRELDRLKVIQSVVDMGLKPGRAAERLGLTVRQIERLVIRYRECGAAGLTSRKRGRQGNRRLDENLAQRALAIIRERYADFGPTLAREKFYERHRIRLAKETVRRLMTDAGLWIPRKQRPPKLHQPRNRRACLGELIQIDGSDHRWFEERGRRARCWCMSTMRTCQTSGMALLTLAPSTSQCGRTSGTRVPNNALPSTLPCRSRTAATVRSIRSAGRERHVV